MRLALTRRGELLLALLFALFLIGLATVNGGVIALAIPPAIFLAAGIMRRPEALHLKVERTLSAEHAKPGSPVMVQVRITNHGAALDEVCAADEVPGGLRIAQGETSALSSMAAGQSLDLTFTVQGDRGEYRFTHTAIRTGDEFGLFQLTAVLPAPGHLLIHPEAPRLRRMAIHPPRTRGFAGPIASGQGGVGVDFFNLREYQPGDRLRWLNWKASARRERDLYTNVFEQERVADVGLILDAREQVQSMFEHSAQAAAALAEVFLDDGNRVGLLVYGRGVEGVFPGYGHAQRERIMRALARATTGHNYALESLDRLPTRLFPAQSQVIFISPAALGDVPVLARLRAHGYAVMVVSPDPIEDGTAIPAGEAVAACARRIAVLERRLMFDNLRRVGVQVVNWPVNQTLDAVIHVALARQPVRRIGAGRLV